MGGKEKYQTFKPRRRAFASRPRALFSPGMWAMGFAGAGFGGAVAAGWLVMPQPAEPAAASAEVDTLAQPAPMETAVLIVEAPAPLPAAQPVAAAFEPDPPQTEEPAPALKGVADRIVDGDTFFIQGVETRIRLWGVDAPERNAPGAAEATEALTALIAGKALSCEEMDRDRYARIVARCTLEDGRDIGRVMIDIGAASEMTRYSGGYYGG